MAWITLSCCTPRVCLSMKLSAWARKISATSTVGRLILPSSFGEKASCRGQEWEEHQRGCESTVGDVGTSGDRLWLTPNRRDLEELESLSDPCRVPTDE